MIQAVWVDARYLATLVAIFVMGAAAFDALSERTRRHKVVAMTALVVGVAASLSRGDVFAAFIVFILCGFVLDWWGVVRPDDCSAPDLTRAPSRLRLDQAAGRGLDGGLDAGCSTLLSSTASRDRGCRRADQYQGLSLLRRQPRRGNLDAVFYRPCAKGHDHLLQCGSPELMLWTAPPPARECHGYGGC